jgi:hypothetical protein
MQFRTPGLLLLGAMALPASNSEASEYLECYFGTEQY